MTPEALHVAVRVTADNAGDRLDRFLVHTAASLGGPLQGTSRARLQALIDAGHVLVNGQPAKSSQRLRAGETIAVTVPPPIPAEVAPEPIPLDVLFEDLDMIVLNKPAGLAVHPGAGRPNGTLVNALLAHCSVLSGVGGVMRPGIVHRLDRDTSGVLVVAKHDRAHHALARQFAARAVVKAYVAFVLGVPAVPERRIETAYGRHPTQRKRFSSRVKTGKRAVTTYRTVASVAGLSRLDVLLGTGRTHQIRVHLSDLGHPVLGDPLYGGRRLSQVSDPGLRSLAASLSRQALHAARLELCHPTSGAPMSFVAPLPPELQALWDAMRSLIGTHSP